MLVADAQRVKGLAPLACKSDKVDARVLGELSFRDLVPAIWLLSPELRGAGAFPVAAAPGQALVDAQEPGAFVVDPCSAIRSRWLTCSGSLAGGCLPSWISPSHGAVTSRRAWS